MVDELRLAPFSSGAERDVQRVEVVGPRVRLLRVRRLLLVALDVLVPAAEDSLSQASNSAAHRGTGSWLVGANVRRMRRRLCVALPEPKMSTPSSRSGASALPRL